VSLGPLEAGVNFAERLRALVEKNSFSYNGRVLPPVTISIGIAAMSEVDDFSESALVELADQRLYAAKRGGRNRVVWQ
jgi:diguanylate cyclase (GGDEF)-like protein